MRRTSRVALALRVGCVLLAAGAACAQPAAGDAAEAEPAPAVYERTFDLLVLRPLGAAATAAGAAFFAATAPLVAPAGNVSEVWDVFVVGPGSYTFARPLGRF